MFIAIGQASRLLGVSCTTLRRWDEAGFLSSSFRTIGGHRRYDLAIVVAGGSHTTEEGKEGSNSSCLRPQAVTYARVSAAKQKEDLERQEDHLRSYVERQGWNLLKQYKDIASGLNDQRKGLLALLRDLAIYHPQYLVCRFSDRLARFGIEIIRLFCTICGTTIVLSQADDQKVAVDDQLVQDVISLLTSFSGKLYRRRRGSHHSPLPVS